MGGVSKRIHVRGDKSTSLSLVGGDLRLLLLVLVFDDVVLTMYLLVILFCSVGLTDCGFSFTYLWGVNTCTIKIPTVFQKHSGYK